MEWTYEDLVQAVLEDPEWEFPEEEREMSMFGMEWMLLSL